MDQTNYLEAIEREAARVARVLGSDPSVPVPSCPGWQVADLGVHLGVLHHWAAEMVRGAATERLEGREELFGIDPGDPALVEWYLASAHELVDVLGSTPLTQPVWSWIPGSTALFWNRRQAVETAVHRWDAEAATGEPHSIEAALAADGIDEVLRVFGAGRMRAQSTRAGIGESFHFHCSDTEGEWTVRFDGPGMVVRAEHDKADVALHGAASQILLFLWGRQPADALDVAGDENLLPRWFELVPSM